MAIENYSFFDWATFVIASGGLILGVIHEFRDFKSKRVSLIIKPKIVHERLIFGDAEKIYQPIIEVINIGDKPVTISQIGAIERNKVLKPLSKSFFSTSVDRETKFLPSLILPGASLTFSSNGSVYPFDLGKMVGMYVITPNGRVYKGNLKENPLN